MDVKGSKYIGSKRIVADYIGRLWKLWKLMDYGNSAAQGNL